MVSLFILLLLLPFGMSGEFLLIETEVVFCHMTVSSYAFISGRFPRWVRYQAQVRTENRKCNRVLMSPGMGKLANFS